MRSFFANKFSRLGVGLLILLFGSEFCYSNQLRTNEEKNMPTRSEVPSKNKWNVEALYQDPSHWNQDFISIRGGEGVARWPEIQKFQGHLKNPKSLNELMENYLLVDRKLSKLATYAHLRLDEDLGNDEFKKNYGLIS